MKDFHCCATCTHYQLIKNMNEVSYHCSRLGYQTKPTYKFKCWNPRENVRKLMDKQASERGCVE